MDFPVRVAQSDDLPCGIVLVVLRKAYASGTRENNSPSHASLEKEIEPLFSSRLFENCPVLKVLPELTGVNFASGYFVFTPFSRSSFMPHFFV